MKTCVLLTLLLALGYVHSQGDPIHVPFGHSMVQDLLLETTQQPTIQEVSCQDSAAFGAAKEALNKINQHRQEGYIFTLHRLSNAHTVKHGDTGTVFYLTMDVMETSCSVLSNKDFTTCEARADSNTPVYGKCRAAIYMNTPHRVVRLYKYDCAVRPVPSDRVHKVCPDCPTVSDLSKAENLQQAQKAASLSLAKFNGETEQANRFGLVQISRSSASWMFMGMSYTAEYAIQETTCAKASTDTNCPFKDSSVARKGFCKGSFLQGRDLTSVNCDIYEPDTARTAQAQVTTGTVRVLSVMVTDEDAALPAFPDAPAGPEVAVTLPAKQDPQIPGQTEPTIQAFPVMMSAHCTSHSMAAELLVVDPTFKYAV